MQNSNRENDRQHWEQLLARGKITQTEYERRIGRQGYRNERGPAALRASVKKSFKRLNEGKRTPQQHEEALARVRRIASEEGIPLVEIGL